MAENSAEPVLEQSEAVAAASLGSIGNGVAFYTNQGYQQALQASAGNTSINQAVVAKASESLLATSPAEGASSAFMASLLNSLAGNQNK